MSKLQNFLKGLIKENPVLVLVLGTCPTLAISTSVIAAFGMGIAATAVLILSNMAISAIRKIVPDPVRIPCYIVVIAGFVTVVELVMEAYAFCSRSLSSWRTRQNRTSFPRVWARC